MSTKINEPWQILAVAKACIVDGIDQHSVANLIGVSNAGRVAEIVVSMRYVLDHMPEIYKLAKAEKEKS